MGEEYVTVRAGGFVWSAFRRVMVKAAIKEAARSFHLDIAAEPSPGTAAWAFKAGTLIEITSNGELLLAGYVDRYQPRLNGHQQAEIAVSGRSKAQDLIDSSAVHKTGHFKNKTPLQILQELDKAGVGVKTDQTLDPVPTYRITPGESVFRIGEKLCREQGVTLCGQADGSILITAAGGGMHTALVEGVNIMSIEADHNWSGRHSDVIVRGQAPYGHGPDALEIEAKAQDAAVGRNRPVIVLHDGDIDRKRAKKRAKNRRDKEAGNSLKANVTVQGFRDDAGKLWTPSWLVWLESPFAAVAQMMCVESVQYQQDRRGGSETVLTLVDPRAHGGKSGGGSSGKTAGAGASTGEAWNNDAGTDAVDDTGVA